MKKIIALLLALVMVFSLAACGEKTPAANGSNESNATNGTQNTSTENTTAPEENTSEEVGPTVLRQIYSSEVNSLNYLVSGENATHKVTANIIDTLVEHDQHGNIVPGLAESWTVSDDGTVYTFKLRANQKWYDSEGNEVGKVEAQNFVDAMKYVCTSEYDSKVQDQVNCVKNAKAYYNKEVTDFAEVGVKALDELTVEYTLERPVPYFLSALNYGPYMPAMGSMLDEYKEQFGVDATKMAYCGAYLLKSFEPQVGRVEVKNPNYWDAENVYIEELNYVYNAEADTLAPEMVLRGEIDTCELTMDIIDDWKANHPEYVSKGRDDNMWSYFFCFDYRPCYAEEWGPENWALAVMNSNFRHSIMSAYDATFCVGGAYAPEGADSILERTVTPKAFTYDDAGTDFTQQPAFKDNDQYFFNKDKALEYKAKAMEELEAIGVTFPVTVVLTYKSGDADWENFYVLFKQQVEGVLGTDYITCVLNAGPSENFLSATRRAGDYSLQLCNWGADYVDPETWTDPFGNNIDVESGRQQGSSYDRAALVTAPEDYKFFYQNEGSTNASVAANIDKIIGTEYFAEFGEMYKEYMEKMDLAKQEGVDINERHKLFAEAEDMLIENAVLIPSHISPATYQIVNWDIFEGPWAPSGLAGAKYKWIHLKNAPVTMEEFQAAYDAWSNE